MKDLKDAQSTLAAAAERDCARGAGGDRVGQVRVGKAFRIPGFADEAHEVVQEAFAGTSERINEEIAIRNIGSRLSMSVQHESQRHVTGLRDESFRSGGIRLCLVYATREYGAVFTDGTTSPGRSHRDSAVPAQMLPIKLLHIESKVRDEVVELRVR